MHRRPRCNGNTLMYKRPLGQLIHPCSLCVNVINVVYLIDTWHHAALKPSAADTPETPAFIEYAIS